MEKHLTAKEVAKRLKMHLDKVYILLRTGQLKSHKSGRYWRIRQEDLIRFLKERKIGKSANS